MNNTRYAALSLTSHPLLPLLRCQLPAESSSTPMAMCVCGTQSRLEGASR